MKIWVDDIRPAPAGYVWCKTNEEAIAAIHMYEHQMTDDTILISLDYDAGDFAHISGDYIAILNYLEAAGIVDLGYFFNLHSMNVVGVQNMRAIIQRNGWREI